MTNLRLNRDTKASAFFRNEIDKFVRKSRVKKRNKDKIAAFRDSLMRDSRSFRDFVFESKSQSELVVDLFIVVSVAFVAFVVSIVFVISIVFVVSIVSVSIDNATLLKMLFHLFISSSDASSSLIDSAAILVINFFSIDSISTSVTSVIISTVIFEMIEIVDDSNRTTSTFC
jgi:hypothetical protein